MPSKQLVIYRPFLGLEVKQDIESMLYNATDVLKAYNSSNDKKKDLDDYLNNKETKDYLSLLNTQKSGELEIMTTRRGKFGGTRMHQELLVDFMMWLSVEFKQKAIQFIIEGLTLAGKRNELKEGFKKMTSAIANSGNANYREEVTMINVLCTGSCASNQRARLGIDAMKQMDDLQITNANLIKAGLSLEERKNILVKSL